MSPWRKDGLKRVDHAIAHDEQPEAEGSLLGRPHSLQNVSRISAAGSDERVKLKSLFHNLSNRVSEMSKDKIGRYVVN